MGIAALTVSLGPSADVVGPGLVNGLSAPDRELRASDGGRAEEAGDEIRLTAPQGRAVVWFPVHADAEHDGEWLLTARIATPSAGRSVRVALATAGDPPLWVGSQRVDTQRARPGSAEEWADVALRVPAELAGRDAKVGVVARGPGVDVRVASIDLVPIRRRWERRLGEGVVLALGLAFTGAVARWAGWAAAILVVLLGVGVTLPAPWLTRFHDATWWLSIGPWSLAFVAQKLVGHLGTFAALSTLARRGGLGFGPVVGSLTLLALGSEAAQTLAVARSPSWADVGFDLAGVALGWVLGGLRGSSGAPARPASGASPP